LITFQQVFALMLGQF